MLFRSSGLVYSLGDFTAQSYEGRALDEYDGARIARSGACGFFGHGPLSHFYYNALDRFFIVTPVWPAAAAHIQHQACMVSDAWTSPVTARWTRNLPGSRCTKRL